MMAMLKSFDLVKWIERQKAFSSHTFGPGDRTKGIIAHVRKELTEIEESRTKEEQLGEWVDVVILSLDAMWRLGYDPEEIAAAIHLKQLKNTTRRWPDWRTKSLDEAIEHDRTADPPPDP
jgi:hypothetical protein